MRAGLPIILLAAAVGGCATPPPPEPPLRDPGVSFDFKVVPRPPDVAAYPSIAEHVWVPTPANRTFVVVRVINNAKPKPIPAPNFVRVTPPLPTQPQPVSFAPPPHWDATIGFAFDRSNLDSKARVALDKLLQSVGSTDQISVVLIDAYADGKGTDPYNDRLTERRGESVKAYLISKGIKPALVTSNPHGKRDPIAPNTTDEGRATNRRANVQIDGSRP